MDGRSANMWHALGYQTERARSAMASRSVSMGGGGGPAVGAPAEREAAGSGELDPHTASAAGRFVAATGASLLARTLHRWLGRKAPSLPGLVRGAAAGIGAAGVLAAARYLVGVQPPRPEPEADLLDELLEGAGYGLAYASILEPHLPGPPLVRGLVAGTAEHLTAPWGGLFGPLQSASPHAKVPGLERLLSPLEVGERPLFDHLLYAVVLAVLYGRRRS